MQDAHSLNRYCNSQPKTVRLQQRFYSRTNRATGTTKIHNEPVRSDEDRHVNWTHDEQRQIFLQFWAESLCGRLVGPHNFPARVSGSDFLLFFKQLHGLLKYMCFSMRLHIWFNMTVIHHIVSLKGHQWLSENYSGGRIGRQGGAPVS
jgi:hypothetical protein